MATNHNRKSREYVLAARRRRRRAVLNDIRRRFKVDQQTARVIKFFVERFGNAEPPYRAGICDGNMLHLGLSRGEMIKCLHEMSARGLIVFSPSEYEEFALTFYVERVDSSLRTRFARLDRSKNPPVLQVLPYGATPPEDMETRTGTPS